MATIGRVPAAGQGRAGCWFLLSRGRYFLLLSLLLLLLLLQVAFNGPVLDELGGAGIYEKGMGKNPDARWLVLSCFAWAVVVAYLGRELRELDG